MYKENMRKEEDDQILVG